MISVDHTAPPDDVRSVDWVLAAVLAVLTVASAGYAVFFLPSYAGVVPVPLSALLGAGIVVATVRTNFALTRSMLGAALPALGWFAVTVTLGSWRTLGYGLVLQDWRAFVLFGIGSLAAAGSLAWCWADRVAALARRPSQIEESNGASEESVHSP